jgi:hypothetical protein
MNNMTAALLHLLQLFRLHSLIVTAAALPGEIIVFLGDSLDYTTRQQKNSMLRR